MSTFSVPVKKIRAIEIHPNADSLEFAVIDGYRSIIRKGQFKAGDLVAYIPEAAVLPEWTLRQIGLWDEEKGKGRLSGTEGNRVKAIRLRGELSQGICYPIQADYSDPDAYFDGEPDLYHYLAVDESTIGLSGFIVAEGDDVARMLGITKYEPPIPTQMDGEVFSAGDHLTIAFDVENYKSYPDIFEEGEEVIFTEKLHGTFTGIAILPFKDAHPEAFGERKNILIFSKGLGKQGLVFKNSETNANNLYVRATRALINRIDRMQAEEGHEGPIVPNFILGETYGKNVQDLAYGEDLGFRVFAGAYGYRGSQRYFDWASIEGALKSALGFETVPVVYRGPFDSSLMHYYTQGDSVLGAGHIREGIVITPSSERHHPNIGRVCLKSISPDYLTRKNGTEYT